MKGKIGQGVRVGCRKVTVWEYRELGLAIPVYAACYEQDVGLQN